MQVSSESCEWNPIWDEWFLAAEVSLPDYTMNACRVRAGNSCGSGSFVGFDDRGSYVLSNAHVTGSRIGSNSTFQFDPSVSPQPMTGRIVMAGYSTRVTADWSVSLIPGWKPRIKPAWCSNVRPTNQDRFRTTGSPSCVWPLRHQQNLQLLSNNNAGFAVWNQPAIPGQSGSAVWNMATGLQQLLLTWRTGNGNGAGQPLDFIWAQAQAAIQTGSLIGGELPEDAEMLSEVNPDAIPGFFCEASIRSLPIWEHLQRPTQPPVEPDPQDPAQPLPVPKAALVESYRKIRDEASEMLAKLEIAADSTPIVPPAGSPTFGL
jgi:hypothetical protein